MTSLTINAFALILLIPFVLIFLPLFLITSVCIFLYRQFVILLSKVFASRDYRRILTSRSALLTASDDLLRPRHTLISTLILEGDVDIEHVRKSFYAQVINLVDEKRGELVYPELRQCVGYWMGFPFWKSVRNFDINKLIHFYNEDGTQSTDFNLVQKYANFLTLHPFPPDQPLWEFVVFPNFKPDKNVSIGISSDRRYSAVIIRSHHGLADAFSQLGIVANLAQNKTAFDERNMKPRTKNKGSGGWVNLLRLYAKAPFTMGQMIGKRLFLVDRWKTPVRQGSVESDQLCYNTSRNFFLREINQIKDSYKVKGTAVLYSVVVSAVKRTLFSEMCPRNVVIVTPLPLKGASGRLRNHFTLGSITFPMLDENSSNRLKLMQTNLDEMKQSSIPLIYAIAMKLGGSLPRFCIKLMETRVSGDNVILVSNVAGPKGPSDFAGYPIIDFLVDSGAALGTSALVVSILSINGKVRVSVSADAKVMGSQEKAKEFTEAFFHELSSCKMDCVGTLSNVSV